MVTDSRVDIAVCILTYNSGTLVETAVRSVLSQTSAGRIGVLLMDNASTAEHRRVLEALEDEESVVVEVLPENVGYARGNNYAIVSAWLRWRPKFTIIMNPDVELKDTETLAALSKALEGLGEDAVAIQPRVLPQGVGRLNGAYVVQVRCIPRWVDLAVSESILLRSLLRKTYSRFICRGLKLRDAVVEVEVLSGAFMMCRTRAFIELGMFDPRTFLYCEEYCLAQRMKMAGKVAYILGDRAVYHRQGTSTKLSMRTASWAAFGARIESSLFYLRVYTDALWWQLQVVRMCMYLGYLIRVGLAGLLRLGHWVGILEGGSAGIAGS